MAPKSSPAATACFLLLMAAAGVAQVLAGTGPGEKDTEIGAERRSPKVVPSKTGAVGRKLLKDEYVYEEVRDPAVTAELHRMLGTGKHKTAQFMVAPGPNSINQTQIALNGLSDGTINQVQQAVSQLGSGYNTAIQIVIINEKGVCP
ncbi:hypothetical protein KFL_002390070 [Klebsormidium nitens]|uniref:Uncharacterized protein n=1 Tax=Klebsormidium nitens TaxID=105231 RepID=A0A1Y1I3K0_KLENI|nr:hypothetical protein KFL_002390070 [Klebsormidium nitens]|eukprot:GAQ85515.1 hypothetical protein KFL_002390070 [Klebsormidium nitens]